MYRDWYLFDRWPDRYLSFFGAGTMPKVNLLDESARGHTLDAARHWLELGVDGFRVDHATGPAQPFWAHFRLATREARDDCWTFAEAVETPAREREFEGVLDGCLDFTLLEAFRKTFAEAAWDGVRFWRFIDAHSRFFSPDFVRPSFLDNHDMNRFLWVAGNDKRRLELAAFCQFTLEGPPVVYYGTEVGMSQLRDVRETSDREARSPMAWDDVDDSLVALYRDLSALRRRGGDVWRAGRSSRRRAGPPRLPRRRPGDRCAEPRGADADVRGHQAGAAERRDPGLRRRGGTVASVTFDGVGKTYNDGTRAVSDLNLEVNDGEFVVLVGPSGCGKTTALRMVAGLEEITDGEIRIGERVVNWVDPQNRDIAMVFQNYALYPQMTVADNIAFGLKMRKVPRRERSKKVEEIARILGLQDFLNRKPGNLSGGQRQRVAMGRAIVREPKAFLMDEPLSNLDAKLRVQMRAEISRIQREVETTTIYVTHDQVEAMTMGDRVAVMRHGELQQVDEPQRLFDSPSNLFVASFIGSPPMNLVEARIDAATARSRVVRRPGADDSGRRRHAAFEAARLRRAPGRARDPAAHHRGRRHRRWGRRGRLRGVQLTEALGSELVAHVSMPGKPVEHEAVIEGAVYEESEQVSVQEISVGTREGETSIVASLDPSSGRAKARTSSSPSTHRLHFFDLESAAAIDGRA